MPVRALRPTEGVEYRVPVVRQNPINARKGITTYHTLWLTEPTLPLSESY